MVVPTLTVHPATANARATDFNRDAVSRRVPERIPFDRVADVYDATRGLPPRVLARATGVLSELLQGRRVLEVGVGTGRYAVPLQKSGIRLIGVDIAPKMVARGLEKGMRDVVFADGATLPFRDGSFGAATTNHVLHLVADWRNVLREIRRVLRTEGFYFSVIERERRRALSERYRDIARGLGYAELDPGVHERDFPDRTPPERVLYAGHHEEAIRADEVLDTIFARRLYAFLWKVPDELHAKVMRAMRQEFGGKTIDGSYDLDVVVWTRQQLSVLAETTGEATV